MISLWPLSLVLGYEVVVGSGAHKCEQSPGLARLTELIDKAEEAVSSSRPTVARQHVISQVVLRRYVEVLPEGKRLVRVNLATGQVELITTNAAGWVRDFVPVDSKATEDLWQQVENRLNPAMDAALNGTALGNAAHLKTLKDAVALHFIRNPQTLEQHNKSFKDALDRFLDAVAKTPVAAEAFRRKSHLAPASPGDLRLGAEAFYEPMMTLHRVGGMFRLSVQRLYENVCNRFDNRSVEILTPASANKEFLIGDGPAITLKQSTGEFGISQGITVDEADEIFGYCRAGSWPWACPSRLPARPRRPARIGLALLPAFRPVLCGPEKIAAATPASAPRAGRPGARRVR